MKTEFLVKEDNKKLILFFAGWSMDKEPFKDYTTTESDLLLVYDYSDMAFEKTILESYNEIKLIGWSMGVWAASVVFGEDEELSKKVNSSIAINGTNFPIDNERGITESIYNGTLETLDERSLLKFQLRMCGGKENYDYFLSRKPKRDIEDIKNELFQIRNNYKVFNKRNFQWKEAAIGKDDKIFLYDNQLNAFRNNSEIVLVKQPHYSDKLLREYISE